MPSLRKKPGVFLLTWCGSLMPPNGTGAARGLERCQRMAEEPRSRTCRRALAMAFVLSHEIRLFWNEGAFFERCEARLSESAGCGVAVVPGSGIKDPHRVSRETEAPGERRALGTSAGQPQNGTTATPHSVDSQYPAAFTPPPEWPAAPGTAAWPAGTAPCGSLVP